MTHWINSWICAALGLFSSTGVWAAQARPQPLPLCTISAITRPLPGELRYEIGLKRADGARIVPLRRVKTLEEAIHFVLAERRHSTCRPPLPSERRDCTFTAAGRLLVMNYAARGTQSEPVATFSDQNQASLVLRQMRNAYLCN
jgi:hypothetical protein